MIELVAITDDPAPPPPPLHAVPCGELTAICRPARARDVTAEALWCHLEVVESLMEERELLPVRFGTLVADDGAAARAVRSRHDELAADLARVRGAVELAIRVASAVPEADMTRGGDELAPRVTSADPDPPPTHGADYLRARARRADVARLVHDPLAAIAREAALLAGPDLLRSAYLVDRPAARRFVALVERIKAVQPQLALICTGPWPPYTFAQGAPA